MIDEVIIRPWRHEDAAPLAAIANNRKIWLNVRDRFPHPYKLTDAFDWIKHMAATAPYENMAVVYNDALAGSVGVSIQSDVYRKSIEVGYFIGEPFWGKGIATRAIALWLAYVQKHFDIIRIYAEVFEANEASKKVLMKNGFRFECKRYKSVIKDNVIMNDEIWVKFV